MARESNIWYRSPAEAWTEALPLGNGRLGAMAFGGINNERIQMNEESVWSGGYRNRNNPDSIVRLDKIRALLQSGSIEEAENLTRYSLSGTPEFQRTYQTLGDLQLTFHDIPETIQNYKRCLNLDNAISTVRYEAGGYLYEREVFISAPSDIIAMRLTTSNPQGMCFDARLVRDRFCEHSGKDGEHTVFFDGTNGGPDGISFCCMMTGNAADSNLETIGEYLVFKHVKEATIYITTKTSFRSDGPAACCAQILQNAKQKTYDDIRREHIEDYTRLEARMSFTLDNKLKDAECLPTNERLALFCKRQDDLGLIELYFRFGRYLLISSSRPGCLPATLQGIWCDEFLPPWDSKYTININTQMNYWPAEICNLSDCHLPLFGHIKRMYENGKETARSMYGARGFVAHHNTDIWGDTAPQDSYVPATYWVMGAAWLCLHIWEHYQYTLDMDFLKEHYYLLKDACLFFVDYLIENEKGELIISPTVSPENTYIASNGKSARLCSGSSMDSQILFDLFTSCISACMILNKDIEFADNLDCIRGKLPPLRIGKHGAILEWPEDYEETEPGHRHISHLYALFPGSGLSPEKNPEMALAARKTLERRLSFGGGHTGWSRAWIINFWARLGDGEKALENINRLLSDSTLPNLFDNHPPFQIDGNFGGITAIANIFVQSEQDTVYLLKALPKKWRDGHVSGICAKGGLIIDIEWKNGVLSSVDINAKNAYSGTIIYNGSKILVDLRKGAKIHINSKMEIL